MARFHALLTLFAAFYVRIVLLCSFYWFLGEGSFGWSAPGALPALLKLEAGVHSPAVVEYTQPEQGKHVFCRARAVLLLLGSRLDLSPAHAIISWLA